MFSYWKISDKLKWKRFTVSTFAIDSRTCNFITNYAMQYTTGISKQSMIK